MSKFQEILQTEINDIAALPLLHTCDAYSLRSILEYMSLIPQMCDVFNSDLLYTYYGIPSYRLNYNLATTNPAYYGICFILDPIQLEKCYKVFPFDSGAFQKHPEFKEMFFHHKTQILDFELEADITSAMKVIKTFYQSNENYVFEKPEVKKEFSLLDFEAISYKNLISNTTNNKFDNRASSIEIIFNEKIILDKNSVKQIIIPKVFRDDKKISQLLIDNFDIDEPLTYSTFRGTPREFFGEIRSQYLNFLNIKYET